MAFSAVSCKRDGSETGTRDGSETGTQIEETELTRVRDTGSEKNPPKVSEGGIPADRAVVDAERQAKYYCPSVFNTTAVPCRINIETGEKQFACPVEGCDHFGKGCYFYNKSVTGYFDTGNYLIIQYRLLRVKTNYFIAFEWDTGTMYEIASVSETLSYQLIPGIVDKEILGYYNQDSAFILYGIDLCTGEKTKKQKCTDVQFLFCDGGKVYAAGKNGPCVLRTPESEPEPFVYPYGCSGFKVRKPGVLYRTDAPAAIYDIASKKTVKPDRKLDITSPVRSGDVFYYQSRGGVQTGKKSDGTEISYVRYDNDIYRQGLDGKAEKFSIPTDYHFIVYASDGDWVIGRLMYRLSDGVYTPFEELDYDHIRINLTTGKAQLLNLYVEHDYFLD